MSAYNILTLDISSPAKPKRIPSDQNTFDFLAVRIGASNLTIAESSGNFNFGNNILAGVADGTDPDHAVNKSQLDLYIPATEKGAANGVAPLNASSKINSSYLPAIAITEVFVVPDIAARDALTIGAGDGEVQEGDVAVVLDGDGNGNRRSFIYDGSAYQSLNDGTVTSVNGQTGSVVLSTTDISEGTNLYFTDERAQDAVGTILTDTNSIDFTYNDGSNLITADVKVDAAGALSITASGVKVNVDGDTTKIASNNLAVDHAKTKTNDNAGAITVRQVVYVKSNGNVDLAIATNTALFDAEFGVVEDASIASAGSGKIVLRRGAIVGGFTGLTPGKHQFLSRTTAGALVEDLSGFVATNQVISIGKAISATEIAFDPQYLFEF